MKAQGLYQRFSLARIILSGLSGCIAGLALTLCLSLVAVEVPGRADIIGFGGIYLATTVLIAPLIYLPMTLFVVRRLNKQLHLLPAILALLANAPIYIILWVRSGNGIFFSEGALFMTGFFTIAFVFGAGMLWRNGLPKPAGNIST